MNDWDRAIINQQSYKCQKLVSGLNREKEILHTNPQVTFNRENGFYAINKYNKYNEQEAAHC